MDVRIYLLYVAAVSWHVKGSVSCIFSIILTLCLCVYIGDTHMWPLQPSSTSWDNSGVIIGSHVFLITEAQIRGRGAVLAVCLPTSSSDVASNWTLIGANPFTTHTPFPTSTTNHFPHQSWFLYHLSLYPVSSWIMQIQEGPSVKIYLLDLLTIPKALSTLFLKMCYCC